MTSVGTASALPPRRLSSSANTLRRSMRRAPSTTLAPCAERSRAVASPSPLLAPVMTTTFPSMLWCIVLTPTLHDSRSAMGQSPQPYCSSLTLSNQSTFFAFSAPEWRYASSPSCASPQPMPSHRAGIRRLAEPQPDVTIKVWQAAIFVLLVGGARCCTAPSPALAKTATTSMTAVLGIAPIAPPLAQELERCRAETSGYNPQRLMSGID